jgi:hypothetical protein
MAFSRVFVPTGISLLLAAIMVGCSALAPIAETQSARLADAAEARLATEMAQLKATAKARAATAVVDLLDTAEARLATELVEQATLAPTTWFIFKETALVGLKTEAATLIPGLETQSALLGGTVIARLSTEAAQGVPSSQTQLAILQPTIQAGGQLLPGGTPFPGELETQAAAWNATMDAQLATQAAQLFPTPVVPTAFPGSHIITYTVLAGDDLAKISGQFKILPEQIIGYNLTRYPALGQPGSPLMPGWVLILSTDPQNLPVLAIPYGLAPVSGTMGCDVSGVTWLLSPITCKPLVIDIITAVKNSMECVSAENPLGYQVTHTVFQGWILYGADQVESYGWFFDQARNIILLGPAIVPKQTDYPRCGLPGK